MRRTQHALIFFTLVFSIIAHTACFSQPGLVTLEGKQFRLNGQDFYPMVCCYCFNILYEDPFDIADIYLSADYGYGPGEYVPGVVENMPNNEYGDPAVVKVDFTSPHPYPATFARENYSYELAYERFLGRLTWLNRNSPLPWIIGEISLGAMDDYYEIDTVPNPDVWTRYALSPPRVNTSDLQVQKDFAEQSLEDVRNCNLPCHQFNSNQQPDCCASCMGTVQVLSILRKINDDSKTGKLKTEEWMYD